jgi:hypothetical protein
VLNITPKGSEIAKAQTNRPMGDDTSGHKKFWLIEKTEPPWPTCCIDRREP